MNADEISVYVFYVKTEGDVLHIQKTEFSDKTLSLLKEGELDLKFPNDAEKTCADKHGENVDAAQVRNFHSQQDAEKNSFHVLKPVRQRFPIKISCRLKIKLKVTKNI